MLTSGRVPRADPAIEAGDPGDHPARGAGGAGVGAAGSRSWQAIVALCAEPMSVAEISARLRLHLGVTKILVGDLRAAGYLDVHTWTMFVRLIPETILRVMRGLRAIS